MKGALVLALLGTIVLATEARYVKNRRTNLQLSLARLFKQGGPPMGGPPMGGGSPSEDESATKIHQVLKKLSMMKQGPGGGPPPCGPPPPGPNSSEEEALAELEACEVEDDMIDYIEGVFEDTADLSPIQAIITTLVSSDVVSTWMDAGWDEDNYPDIAGTVCPGTNADNEDVVWHIVGTAAVLYASQDYDCVLPDGPPDECPTAEDLVAMTACVREAIAAGFIDESVVRAGICCAVGGPGGPGGDSREQVTKEELLAELKKYLKNH